MAMLEAMTALCRAPARSLLCALSTIVAVAAFTAITGISDSAGNAVSTTFNRLRATTVIFRGGAEIGPAAVTRLTHLDGVRGAGRLWDLYQQQPQTVAVGVSSASPQMSTQLSISAASASALQVIGAQVASGRVYDDGADAHRQMVAVLGESAAEQLGLGTAALNPAITIDGVTVAVIGIVKSVQQQSQLLLNVIVPPYVANVLAGQTASQEVIARTVNGAAQLVGRQGPSALDPYRPGSVSAQVPPAPAQLSSQVESNLNSLLGVLVWAGLGIGVVSITAITSMAVHSRRTEIGLRRAIGYQRRDIALLILCETVSIGVLGGIAGAATGVITTVSVAHSNGWAAVMNPTDIVLAPLIGLAVGVVSGSCPAFRAARITPISALRGRQR